jgi:hypothetical protein
MSNKNAEGYADPTAAAAISTIVREEKAAARYPAVTAAPSPLVYVCSPYRGDTAANAERARAYCSFAISKKAIPFAPHLLYPQFLDDADHNEREAGLGCGTAILKRCDQIWVFGERISGGMAGEISSAKKYGIPIRYFNRWCQEVDGG